MTFKLWFDCNPRLSTIILFFSEAAFMLWFDCNPRLSTIFNNFSNRPGGLWFDCNPRLSTIRYRRLSILDRCGLTAIPV